MNASRFDFVSLGYVSNDNLARVPEIPVDGKVRISSLEIQGGGPAADAAVCAARLGVSTAFISSVGNDDAGKRILADLRADNVDVSAIRVRENCGSPISYCWVDDRGRRSVAWTMNGLELLTAAEVPAEMIRGARVFHTEGHHPLAAAEAAKIAKEAGVLFALDAGTLNDSTVFLAPLADILITSEPFAKAATGETAPEAAVEALRRKYPAAKVIGATFGGRGSYFWVDGKVVAVPPIDVEVIDTTGAGDSFHAGFEVAYAETGDVLYSARFGTVVAGLKCRKLGARAGLPSRAEVLAVL